MNWDSLTSLSLCGLCGATTDTSGLVPSCHEYVLILFTLQVLNYFFPIVLLWIYSIDVDLLQFSKQFENFFKRLEEDFVQHV